MNWPKFLCEPDNVTLCPVRAFFVGVGAVYHAAVGFMVFGQHSPIGIEMLGSYINHMTLLGGTTAGGIGAKSILKGDAK
jgi:hypothetical protein